VTSSGVTGGDGTSELHFSQITSVYKGALSLVVLLLKVGCPILLPNNAAGAIVGVTFPLVPKQMVTRRKKRVPRKSLPKSARQQKVGWLYMTGLVDHLKQLPIL
jgi:hypothetical protein